MIVTINHLEQSGATLDFMFQKPFHSMRKFNEAITEIRYSEAKQFKETNQQNIFNLVASGYSSCEYLPYLHIPWPVFRETALWSESSPARPHQHAL
jgi:hypothetical protein